MENDQLTQNLKQIVDGVMMAEGMELVELDLMRNSGGSTIRILADRIGGGITIDDCARLGRLISDELERSNIIPERYLLEVSSPGLDRPLKSKADFSRCLEKPCRFFLNDLVNDKLEYSGVIKGCDEAKVVIDNQGLTIEIPIVKINKAKQIID